VFIGGTLGHTILKGNYKLNIDCKASRGRDYSYSIPFGRKKFQDSFHLYRKGSVGRDDRINCEGACLAWRIHSGSVFGGLVITNEPS